jgi:fibronectin-binding autotransporter adhesin
MRPASFRIILCTSVLCILAALFAADSMAFGQSTPAPKRKLSLEAAPHQSVAAALAPTPKAVHPLVTTETWTGGGGSGNTNWSDASNWNNGAMTSGENVVITLAGAATTEDNNASIGTLALGSGDSLTIGNNTTLNVGGNIANSGTITLGSTYYGTQLYVGASLTLSGSGVINLSGSGANSIGGASGAILTNTSTIEGGGSGNVGNGQIAFNNSTGGVIDANVSATNLYLDTGAASINTGKLEATGGGTLILEGSSWTNTGGLITAAAGSTVELSGVGVTGGTLTAVGTGVIEGSNNSLTNLTINGTYDVIANTSTSISGTITNNGTINLDSTYYGTDLSVPTGATATLAGTGSVVLAGGPNVINGGTNSTLIIDETISGNGYIGNGTITTMVNNSTINANVSPTVSTTPLYVQPGTGGMTNSSTGVLEATNGGTLVLSGGTLTNSGTIQALGSDSSGNASIVQLQNGISITGGTLNTSGAGVIEGDGTVYLTNVTNKGTYDVGANTTTEISGTITNTGTINLDSTYYGTDLYLATNTTLTGSGSVILGGNGADYISGASGTTLTIDQLIQGGGGANVGNGILTLANNNTINANNGTLIVQPLSTSTNINKATLEATNGGTLELYGGSWTNTGGLITAAAGSTVLLDGSSVTGGTLTAVGTGVIEGENNSLSNLTMNGTYDVLANTTTDISGAIINNGTINLGSTYYGTYLDLAASTKLSGKGSVVLVGGDNYISGVSGATLTNDETIEGAGYVGDGQLKLVNGGTINANLSGATLILDPGVASSNTKTMEATGGGTLELYGSTWTQTGAGTITAATGSTVNLNSTTVTGGVLTTTGTGVIDSTNSTLSNLTNNGTLNVVANTATIISGTITNNGTINLDSNYYGTYLNLGGNTTLNGTGAISMTGGDNYIGGTGNYTLTNNSTIEGWGNLGNGQITITNNGTLDANVSGQSLAILPGSGGFTNYNATTNTLTGGTYIANGGNITFAGSATGITTLSASVVEEAGGQLIDTNGNINALANLTSITSTGSLTTDVNFTDPGAFSNAGSLTILKGTSFTVQSLSQISGSTLTAGTYVLDANLNLSGATQNITTNAANLTLGGGTIENANSTNALAGLATNSGSLTLANDATFTTKGNFSSTGTLAIDKGSSFTVNGTLAQISGSTLSSGTFVLGGNLTVASGVNITTNATSLTLEGGTIDSGTTNALANLASNTGSLTLANSGSFTTGATKFTNSGALTIDSGSTFTVTNTLSNLSSGTLSGGTYVIGGTLQLASANGGIVTNAANLTITGKTAKILDGTANALAGFDNNTGSFTLTGDGTLTTAASVFSNSGRVDVATGSTLTIGGTGNSYNQTAGTTTVDGTLTGAVNLTGGTIQGAGTLKGNVSVGGAGTTPTLNVGDAGLAGLLKITGTYTQLSTGTLNVAIGGLTAGTEYSKMTVSGTASLSGTLTVNMINGFVPAVGKTFTILTAKSITGTFSTQYIVINSSEYFAVTYTATGVVLKVDSGVPPSDSDTSQSAAVVAVVKDKDKKIVLSSDLRKRYSGGELSRPVAASGRGSRDTLAQRYPLDNNLAYRLDNTLDNALHNNVRPSNNIYGLAIWRGPSERPVALPKAPVVGLRGPSLHAANEWTPANRVAGPLVNNWQNNQVRTKPTLRTMPSLMRAR